MLEKEKATPSAKRPFQEVEQGRQLVAEISREQRRSIEWLMLISGPAAVLTTSLYVLLYFQTGAWQMLVVAGGTVMAIVCLVPARWLVRRGKLNAAGYWLVFGVTLAYSACELGWAGATWYLLGGGLLLILLAGYIVMPRRWGAWLVTAALFGAYVWLVNWFEPLPRYDAMQSTVLRLYVPGITALLALGALWQLTRAYQRTGTIRTRLLIAFVALVVLPMTVAGTASTLLGSQNARRQAINQFESVATLKEAEIGTWVRNLQTSLVTALSGEDAMRRARVLLQGTAAPLAYSKLQGYLQQFAKQTEQFEELFLLDLRGRVVLSTDAMQEGKIYSNQTYFQEGLAGPYLQPPIYSPSLGWVSVIAARPIRDSQGQTVGVLAGRANLDTLNEIMLERAGLAETGETYLVGANYALLTASRFEGYAPEETYVRTAGTTAALEAQINGFGSYENYRGKSVIGVYRWLPQLKVALLAEQDQSEALNAAMANLGLNVSITLGAVAIAAMAALFVTRSIATPLVDLAGTATQIAAGDLNLVATVEREDEIGKLAQAFNRMTARLRELISGLEDRVAERTAVLERRAVQLATAAEVSRAASSILDLGELLNQTVKLIANRFALYYAGLFLVDEADKWAVLHAATGEAGQQMLARGHRLMVGGKSMVGWCTAHAQARIALDVGKEAVRFDNPLLPDTRSEMALPLISRGRIIGALDVQSIEKAAFTDEDVSVLQTMADQLASAIENARLFQQVQESLEVERRAYGVLSRKAWQALLRAQPGLGQRYDPQSILPVDGQWREEMKVAVRKGKTVSGTDRPLVTLATPIKVRDQVIGVLDAHKAAGAGEWTPDEIAVLETLTEQLGMALESARLYQDTQRRAERERLIGEVTARMRETLDIDTVLQTAVREISEALSLSELVARIGTVQELVPPEHSRKAQDTAHEGTPRGAGARHFRK